MSANTSTRIRGSKLQQIRRATLSLNPLCIVCQKAGRITAATQVDHIIALTNGGSDTQENRQGLCYECHRLKTADDLGNKRRSGVGADGIPLDPKHHWNT